MTGVEVEPPAAVAAVPPEAPLSQPVPPVGSGAVAAALAELQRQGKHYLLLNSALEYLGHQPADEEVALLAVRSYVALGLNGPAQELLRARLSHRPDLAELAAALRKAPSGRIAWHGLAARFETNLAELLARYPALASLADLFRDVPRRLELFQGSDGNHHVARRGGPTRTWLPDLLDVGGVVGAMKIELSSATPCLGFVVADDRCGAAFDRLYVATQRVFLSFSPRLYLLEMDPEYFGAWLYVRESVAALCHPRVELFVGHDAQEQLDRHLSQHPERKLPGRVLGLPRDGMMRVNGLVAVVDRHAQALDGRLKTSLAECNARFDALPSDYYAERFANRGVAPLRVLGLCSRYTTYLQHAMRDAAEEFRRRGVEFKLLIEPSDHDLIPHHLYAEETAAFAPDLIVCIDSGRFSFLPRNVPFVNWIQDLLPRLLTPEAAQAVGPLDFYVAPTLADFVQAGYPREQGLTWTVATSPQTYHTGPLTTAELARYGCDFSYVSNQSTPPETFVNQCLREFRPDADLARLMFALYQLAQEECERDALRVASRPAAELIERAVRRADFPRNHELNLSFLAHAFIHPMGELLFRQAALATVADYCEARGATLRLYGRGWEAHPRFAKYAQGVAANGEELRCIYRATTINLQITSYGAIHQRLLDGLAAGGFFLLRYSPFDEFHGPGARLAAALDAAGVASAPAAPLEFSRKTHPALAAAHDELADLLGRPRAGAIITLQPSETLYFRELVSGGFRRCAGAVFADAYPRMVYRSAAEFAQRADEFLSDGAARATLTQTCRETVLRRYTNEVFVDELLDFVARRLAQIDRPGQPA